MAVFRPTFHTNLAQTFVDDVYYQRKNLYYYLGRIEPWVDDRSPHPDPDNAYANDVTIRDNIIYLRRISANDVSICCKSYVWTEGEVYDQWDNTKDMTERPFYVMNSEYKVFKCLNNAGGKPSTVEPTEANYEVTKTDDGYVWKYMYTIPLIKRRKFISGDYFPVQTALTDSFYSVGSIDGVVVTNGGSGYSSDPQTTAVVDAPTDPLGTRAEISLFVNAETGSIDSVIIDNPGSGYTTTPNINVVDFSGKGRAKYSASGTAKLQANILDGKLDSVVILDPGIGYPADENTVLSAVGDGEGAILYPKIVDGEIKGVIVANAGSGYTYLDIMAVSANSSGSGAEFQAIVGGSNISTDQSVVEQTVTPGAIYSIVLTEGGEGYSDTTEVVVEGDGEGCIAEAIVDEGGTITGVNVQTFGKDYTYATVTFHDPARLEPNTYKDAEAYAILPPTNGHGYNAVNELYGNIFCIYVTVRDDNVLANVDQDYRQFGVIQDVKDLRTFANIDDTDITIMFTLRLVSADGLEPDMEVMIDNIRHRVVQVNGNRVKVLQLCSDYHNMTEYSGMTYTNPISGAIRYYEIMAVEEKPTANKYSGDLWFSSNNTPFLLTDGRSFGIRSIIRL